MKAAGIQVKHCARAVAIALVLAPAAPVMAQNAGASSQTSASAQTEQTYQFDIPAKPLPQAIADLSAVTGLQVLYTEQSTFDHTAPALQGNYSARDALQQLLAGSGLVMRFTGDNSATIELASQDGAQTLPPVRITGAAIADGSAESGYVSEEVSQVGPWQGRSLQDTPYSINVVSEDLIDNLQMTSQDQLFSMNPLVQTSTPQSSSDGTEVFMRGFEVGTHSQNGITQVDSSRSNSGIQMEAMERVEVLTGPSGFLYGAGNIGGLINYVSKSPTEERLASLTLGNTTGQNLYLHGDFGGQFDTEGTFGYRVNIVTQDGETYIKNNKIKRDSVTAAFDWQVTDTLLLSTNLSWRDWTGGRDLFVVLPTTVERPEPDFVNLEDGWQQDWTFSSTQSKRADFDIRWDISDAVTFRGHYATGENERERKFAFYWLEPGGNTYYPDFRASAPELHDDDGAYAFLDFQFKTGVISHKVTAGTRLSTYNYDRHIDSSARVSPSDSFDLNEPTYIAEPNWPPYATSPLYNAAKDRIRTLTVGDEMTFNEQWSVLAGISDTEITSSSYNASGERTSHSTDNAVTPSVSLLFKPIETITSYVSYIEALEQGGRAGEFYQDVYEVVNAGEILKPQRSEQVEIGIKANVNDVLFTASLYEIDRPLSVYTLLNDAQAKYEYAGRQVHKGLEVTATGKLSNNLTLVGGFSLLDAEIEENPNVPELEGTTPRLASDDNYSAYLEYSVSAVPGLVLNGGVSYRGDQIAVDSSIVTDPIKLDSYTLIDLGARYTHDIGNKPVTIRLNLNNVTDKRYWSNLTALGDRRTFSFSVNMQF